MRSGRSVRYGAAVAVAVLLAAASCTTRRAGPVALRTLPVTSASIKGPVIRIGSFDFSESALLAELYGHALADAGYPVALRLDIGDREVVEPALQQSFVDFVPEYLGSSLAFVGLGRVPPTSDPTISHRELATIMGHWHIAVLTPSPAQDKNVLAVTATTARERHLKTVSDLASVASSMTLGGPPECPQRPYCLPGLRRVYGIDFHRFDPLDAGGPVTVEALGSGQVQAAMLFSTDAAIVEQGFTVLRDDRGLQQAENVTPVVRDPIVKAYGSAFIDVVDSVSAKLDTEELADLNLQVALGQKPAAAAIQWLREHGFGH